MYAKKAGLRGRKKEEEDSKKEIADKRQGRLVLESDRIVMLEGREGEGKKAWMEELIKLRKEVKKDIEELREEWKLKMNNLEGRLERIEKGIEKLKEERGREDAERRGERNEETRKENNDGAIKEGRGRGEEAFSRGGVQVRGTVGSSERFNEREIDRIKRLVREKEKEERKNNIVIKGIKKEGWITKEWVEKFIKEKIDVEVKVNKCRKSNNVLIITLEEEIKKREVMRAKNRLKGEKIFIENDLTWEERKVQEKIYRWVKEERSNGREIKVGFARVNIEGRWIKWGDIERKLERKGGEVLREKRNGVEGEKEEKEGEEKGQNFVVAKK